MSLGDVAKSEATEMRTSHVFRDLVGVERLRPIPGDLWCRICGRLVRNGLVLATGNDENCGNPMEYVEAGDASPEDATTQRDEVT